MTKTSTSSELTRELLNNMNSYKGSPKKPSKIPKHIRVSDVSSSITSVNNNEDASDNESKVSN